MWMCLRTTLNPLPQNMGNDHLKVSSVANLPFPNHFRVWTVSLTLFLHFNLSSITEFHSHNRVIYSCVCVCEKGFELACVRLLNQYLLHPFQLWDLTSSVYLSPSPQPSQNAYIDAPSLAAFPWEKGVPAATPTGVMEHPGPCQPMLAAESTAHADRRLQERPGIFILSAVIENTTSHTQYHSAYIYMCVSNYSLYDSLCPSVYGHWSPP